jgi:uncharacterized protein HemX
MIAIVLTAAALLAMFVAAIALAIRAKSHAFEKQRRDQIRTERRLMRLERKQAIQDKKRRRILAKRRLERMRRNRAKKLSSPGAQVAANG